MNFKAPRHLGILQYNLNKNRETTDSVLNDPSSSKYALLLLQEQYWSKYTKSSLLHQSWTLLEPKSSDDILQYPRAVIYVNNKLLPANSYEPLSLPTTDAIGIVINLQDDTRLLIINIYNTPRTPTLNIIFDYLRAHFSIRTYSMVLMAGDFNLHHPLWNPPIHQAHDAEADELIERMNHL